MRVEYKLHIFVKHGAWNSSGDGEGLHIDVGILQPPMQIPTPVPVVAPEGWAPQVYDQVVLSQGLEPQDFTGAEISHLDYRRAET